MKELEGVNKLKPETELSVQVKQQKEYKLIGKHKYYNGHKCFEYNVETKEIKEAEYERSDVEWNKLGELKHRSKRVIVKKNCTYITALNKQNALKKLSK